MNISIGFSTAKNKTLIGAALIRWWTSKPYSHVFIKIPVPSLGLTTIYHAAHGQVHFKELGNFQKYNDIIKVYDFDIDSEIKLKILQKCMVLAGEKYSCLELVKIFINDILFKLNINLALTGNEDGYICSELVGEFLLELGYIINKPLFLLKPSDIENMIIEQGIKNGKNGI